MKKNGRATGLYLSTIMYYMRVITNTNKQTLDDFWIWYVSYILNSFFKVSELLWLYEGSMWWLDFKLEFDRMRLSKGIIKIWRVLIFNIQSKAVFLINSHTLFISESLIIYTRPHSQEDIAWRSNERTTDTSIWQTYCGILQDFLINTNEIFLEVNVRL